MDYGGCTDLKGLRGFLGEWGVGVLGKEDSGVWELIVLEFEVSDVEFDEVVGFFDNG